MYGKQTSEFQERFAFLLEYFYVGLPTFEHLKPKKNYPKMSQYIISRCLIEEVYECFQLKMCFSGALPTIRKINETDKIK